MTWDRRPGTASVTVSARSARDGRSAREGRPDSGRVIIVSNRGPATFERDPKTGALMGRPGAGGVVSGLLAATRDRPVTWVALAMTDADRAFARAHDSSPAPALDAHPNVALRLVETEEAAYRRYYDGVSNKALWFTQHYLLKPGAQPITARGMRDWDEGYRVVNEAVALATLRELERAGEPALVLFQDYHLYLTPRMVRDQAPWARLAHFVHIPWPEPRYWEQLPDAVTQGIFDGLAANNVVGFQTVRDARNFVDGVLHFLPGASPATPLEGEASALLVDGHRLSVGVYPIAATPEEISDQASETPDAETADLLARARPAPGHKILLRVDRVEPSKNIVAGFRAYERLLAERPGLRGRVTFVALLVPSREGLAEYRAEMRAVRAVVERVNRRFGQPGWEPVIAVYGNDRARALAVMREYDALLVNPVIDGMNLVVKEAALANERNGVIVLSRTAGAYEQLRDYTLGVPPSDITEIARALGEALTMAPARRRMLAADLDAALRRESAERWLGAQLRDLTRATRPVRADSAAARLQEEAAPAALPVLARPS